MTSSNGNIFRVTGPLCGEFTGPGEFPTQRPVTRSFDVFFDLRLNKRLNKQSWGWWFETLSRPFWRHRNVSQQNTWHVCYMILEVSPYVNKCATVMMTSSNGNICRVTGPLCGEFTGHRSFDVFFHLRRNKRLKNARDAGDFKRHSVHYDVIVMVTCCDMHCTLN